MKQLESHRCHSSSRSKEREPDLGAARKQASNPSCALLLCVLCTLTPSSGVKGIARFCLPNNNNNIARNIRPRWQWDNSHS
jgi:hypothetical protein